MLHGAEKVKQRAAQEIARLFELAEQSFSEHPERAHELAATAHSLSLRTKVRFPSTLKRKFCKTCKHYLVPGANMTARTKEGHMVFTCKDCGGVTRFGYTREKKDTQKRRSEHRKLAGNPKA